MKDDDADYSYSPFSKSVSLGSKAGTINRIID